MKKIITGIIIIFILIIVLGYIFLPTTLKNLFKADINESPPIFKIEKTLIEDEIRILNSEFDNIKVSYSIEGELNEINQDYEFRNLLVAYITIRSAMEKDELKYISSEVNKVLSKYIINTNVYKESKIIFQTNKDGKINVIENFVFPLEI